MKRTINDIEKDMHTLCQQIQATLDSNMSGKDKRITMEGFAIQKQKLDNEKARLLRGDQGTVLNCKVGRSVPVPALHVAGDIQESKDPATC